MEILTKDIHRFLHRSLQPAMGILPLMAPFVAIALRVRPIDRHDVSPTYSKYLSYYS